MTRKLRVLDDRLWSKVDVGVCWLWTASVRPDGYGQFRDAELRTVVLAHRYVYELLVGPIPDGLTLDHLCRVRHCVNPDHLEPVTRRINIQRGFSPSTTNAKRTMCAKGHPLSGKNLYIRPGGRKAGMRTCRTCKSEIDGRRSQRTGEA